MKEYEPGMGFVSRVMADVRTYETARSRYRAILFSRPLRYALWACGAAMALANIIRTAFLFIHPAFCG